jgi:hypothetical protein
MTIYEVNLKIRNEIADQFADWLDGHIQQLLQFDGFSSAVWTEIEQEESDEKWWTVHYYVDTREQLEDYLQNHAATMRADGTDRFGGNFTATRRIMREKGRY